MKTILSFLFLFAAHFCSAQASLSMAQTFKQFAEAGVSQKDLTKSSRPMISYSEKQETEGSPYLLNQWAKGTVYLKNKSTLTEPTYVLNFDKTKNVLLMKLSNKEVLEVNMSEIAGFTLEDNAAKYSLYNLPQAGEQVYLVALSQGDTFSLYKSLNTKFYKSDYANKGLYETGYKYDRYVDENTYYITQKGGKDIVLKNLIKSELKKLTEQIPAAKEFLKKQNEGATNIEATLIHLVEFLNGK